MILIRFMIYIVILIIFMFSCSEKEVSEINNQQEIEYIYIFDGEEENPYTGKIIAKYENGQKKWEVNYINAIKEGIQTDWYPNGEKMLKGNYENGKKEGIWFRWDMDGKKSKILFSEGKEIEIKK